MIESGPPGRRRWVALGLLASAQFLVVLDMTIVNVALPSIQHSLRLSGSGLEWVVNAYVLTFGGFLLLGGRGADLLGRRRMFIAGMLVFGAASLADGFAQNPWQLIAARAVQGIGGALLAPAALALVNTLFVTARDRGRAMGIWGAVAGGGGAAGVLLGGVLTDAVGWRWVFWVNVPVTIVAVLLTVRLIDRGRSESAGKLDLLGAVLVTGGLSALVFGLVQVQDAGFAAPRTLIALGAAVVALVGFVVRQARVTFPLLSLRTLAIRTVAAANLVMVIFVAGMFTMLYFLSLFMQQVLGYTAWQAGAAIVPQALFVMIFAQVAGRVAARTGTRTALVAGLVLVVIGLAWFSRVTPTGGYIADLLGPSLVVSAGGGLASVSLVLTATTGVPVADAGLAGGLINVSQQIGSAIGLAVVATAATARTAALAPHGAPDHAALTSGFQLGFLLGSGLVLVAAVVAACLVPGKPAPVSADQVPAELAPAER